MPSSSPGSDDVLRWLAELERRPDGLELLSTGISVVEHASARFGIEQRDAVALRLFDLHDEGLVRFEDPARSIGQIPPWERLRLGADFRVTSLGQDRVNRSAPAPSTVIHQYVTATQSQVAAGSITNYVSFTALLDRAASELEGLDDIAEDDREEARGLLAKLRAGDVAQSGAGSAGGAVLGAVLKQLLGLP